MHVTWNSHAPDNGDFFRATVEVILMYDVTVLALTKTLQPKIDRTSARMPRVIFSISSRQHPNKAQLHGCIAGISTNLHERRMRFTRRSCRSKQDLLLWTQDGLVA